MLKINLGETKRVTVLDHQVLIYAGFSYLSPSPQNICVYIIIYFFSFHVYFYIIFFLLVNQFIHIDDPDQGLTLPMHLQWIFIEGAGEIQKFSPQTWRSRLEKTIIALEKKTRYSFCFTEYTSPSKFIDIENQSDMVEK